MSILDRKGESIEMTWLEWIGVIALVLFTLHAIEHGARFMARREEKAKGEKMETTTGKRMSIAFSTSLDGLGLINITAECTPDNLTDVLCSIWISLNSYTIRHAALIKKDKSEDGETTNAN